MTISVCTKRKVISIPASASIGNAVDVLIDKHIGLPPVLFAISLWLFFTEKLNHTILAIAGATCTIASILFALLFPLLSS